MNCLKKLGQRNQMGSVVKQQKSLKRFVRSKRSESYRLTLQVKYLVKIFVFKVTKNETFRQLELYSFSAWSFVKAVL